MTALDLRQYRDFRGNLDSIIRDKAAMIAKSNDYGLTHARERMAMLVLLTFRDALCDMECERNNLDGLNGQSITKEEIRQLFAESFENALQAIDKDSRIQAILEQIPCDGSHWPKAAGAQDFWEKQIESCFMAKHTDLFFP